jgi:hypothetical protein
VGGCAVAITGMLRILANSFLAKIGQQAKFIRHDGGKSISDFGTSEKSDAHEKKTYWNRRVCFRRASLVEPSDGWFKNVDVHRVSTIATKLDAPPG